MRLWSLPSSHSFEVTSTLGQGLVVQQEKLVPSDRKVH